LDIYLDSKNQLWIGTDFGGLCKFDRAHNQFIRYTHDPSDPTSISSNIVMTIFEDHTGLLWLGTYGGGLNRFDPDRARFSHYQYHSDNPDSISHDTIACIHETPDGILWIGTIGGGLNKFNPESNLFTRYSVKDGLANNCVYGILEDNEGRLWMSTNNGISRFDPGTQVFKNFNSNDGLQSNEFNTFSYCKDRHGEMFFGGINGMNSFFPEEIKTNEFIPPIVFTRITKFGIESSEIKHFFNNDTIKMSYKDSISLEFSALDYSNPDKNQYAYMLEGLHDDWIQLGNKHEITFAKMTPGKYNLKVKGTNSSGKWNNSGVYLSLIITPPFWQTWWFQGIMVLLILILIYRWHQIRLKRQAKKLKYETLMERFFIRKNLSNREREVILLILNSKSNKDIEDELFISLGTVKNHIYNIYKKLNVNSRVQLVNLIKNLRDHLS